MILVQPSEFNIILSEIFEACLDTSSTCKKEEKFMKDWSVHTAGWYWRTQYKLAKLDDDTVKSALKMQGNFTMQCVSLYWPYFNRSSTSELNDMVSDSCCGVWANSWSVFCKVLSCWLITTSRVLATSANLIVLTKAYLYQHLLKTSNTRWSVRTVYSLVTQYCMHKQPDNSGGSRNF